MVKSVSVRADWLLDLGHSRAKWALAQAGELVDDGPRSCPLDDLGALERDLASGQAQRLWMSAQSSPDVVDSAMTLARNHGLSARVVSLGSRDLPVKPAYDTLGCDRWLAMQWPWQSTHRGFCVIDCGTAVTVDIVDDQGVHLGGWIMAGLRILRAGLFAHASRLVDFEASQSTVAQDFEPPATDSARAIAAGTMAQISAALEQALRVAGQHLGRSPAIWLTGGDGRQVAEMIDHPATIDDMLVLRGLALAAQSS